jgi:hypothetical protein
MFDLTCLVWLPHIPLAFMNERTISSAQTFIMKCLFPVVWISGFGFGTLVLFLGGFHGRENAAPPESMKWEFLAIWIAGSAFIWWVCARLKKVQISNDSIIVSNFLKEIRIPFDQIIDVTENRWINIHPVTIHLRSATCFGSRIMFMPTKRLFGWRTHPIVGELRKLANLTSN